jgi:hypothetical protein
MNYSLAPYEVKTVENCVNRSLSISASYNNMSLHQGLVNVGLMSWNNSCETNLANVFGDESRISNNTNLVVDVPNISIDSAGDDMIVHGDNSGGFSLQDPTAVINQDDVLPGSDPPVLPISSNHYGALRHSTSSPMYYMGSRSRSDTNTSDVSSTQQTPQTPERGSVILYPATLPTFPEASFQGWPGNGSKQQRIRKLVNTEPKHPDGPSRYTDLGGDDDVVSQIVAASTRQLFENSASNIVAGAPRCDDDNNLCDVILGNIDDQESENTSGGSDEVLLQSQEESGSRSGKQSPTSGLLHFPVDRFFSQQHDECVGTVVIGLSD